MIDLMLAYCWGGIESTYWFNHVNVFGGVCALKEVIDKSKPQTIENIQRKIISH